MQAWFRLLVVWFIALALPIQGVASATMAHCGPGHQPMHVAAGTPSVPQAAQPHAAGAAHAHHQPHDEGAAAHSAGHPEPAPHAAAQPGKFTGKFADLAKYKCSSCASCCAGAALRGAMPRVPDSEPAPTVFAEATVTVDPFASDGPDRPPRRTHAA
jgi:hypothetical protein